MYRCHLFFFHIFTVVNRNKLLKIPNLVSMIIGIPTHKLSDCITSAPIRKAHIILNDPDHPLHRYFILLPSGRQYRLPICVRGLTLVRVLFLQRYEL